MILLCAVSRAVNRAVTGRPEMICAWLHWTGPAWAERAVDALFWLLRGDEGHCRMCGEFEERDALARRPR